MGGQPQRNSTRQWVFGPFVFHEGTAELSKHGVRIRLAQQPLEILASLLQVPGQLVSRDELRQRLWTGKTFGDFDHGLNAAINRLRAALGDSADSPRYIETVAGRGYRLVAPVHLNEGKPILMVPHSRKEADPAVPLTSVAEDAPVVRHASWYWLAAGILLAGAGLGLVRIKSAPAAPITPVLRFSVSPPDGFAMEAGSSRETFALSPDGSRLAYTALATNGLFQTFVRNLGSLESAPVPESLGSYHVFWAPDGTSLYLTVNGKLRRTRLDGEAFHVICDTPSLMLSGVPVGDQLLLSARLRNYLVPASGGTPTPIQEFYPWPQLLPDGQHLLYTVFDPKSSRHRARVVEWGRPANVRDLLETESRTFYVPSAVRPETGYLLYVRAGNLLAHPFDPRSIRLVGEARTIAYPIFYFFPTGAADFSVSTNGLLAYRRYLSRSQLAWVNRRGEIVRTIGPANVNLKYARLSPDGRKVATAIYDVNRGSTDIWVIDSASGAARLAITTTGLVANPSWSPDSRRLVYNSALEVPPKLFIQGIGEGDQPEALPPDDSQIASDWSPNGRFIAFTNTGFTQTESEGHGDVSLIDLSGQKRIVRILNTRFHEAHAAFTPDGRWLTFTSTESGRPEIYLQAFDESGHTPRLVGERYRVSQQGGLALRWRRDGKELFYLARDGMVYAVPVEFTPAPRFGTPARLFAISPDARASFHALLGFDVSPDGRQLLVPVVTSNDKTEIVVIQNWEAAGAVPR